MLYGDVFHDFVKDVRIFQLCMIMIFLYSNYTMLAKSMRFLRWFTIFRILSEVASPRTADCSHYALPDSSLRRAESVKLGENNDTERRHLENNTIAK